MLLLPLHKPLDRDSLPWAALVLIAINVLVFVALQRPDAGVLERAAAAYRGADLATHELPAIDAHLRAVGETRIADALAEVPEPARSDVAVSLLAYFDGLNAELSAAAAAARATPSPPGWAYSRDTVDAQLDALFTPRWMVRYDAPWNATLLTATFLHADWAHLLGNLAFLLLFGLMVNGALGHAWFLALYLIAGIASSAFAALINHGGGGAALGASGAIAGLMGALAVLWGLRKVRVFYWLFVVFGYTRLPALLLLPAWLGWELYQWWAFPEVGIGFDAHAGGIMAGALLAVALRSAGVTRADFLDAGTDAVERDAHHAGARVALARLDFEGARALMANRLALGSSALADLEMAFLAEQDQPRAPGYATAARRVLDVSPANAAEVEVQARVLARFLPADRMIAIDDAATIVERTLDWLALGVTEPAALWLKRLWRNAGLDEAELRRAAFRLVLRWREAGRADDAQPHERAISERWPVSIEASKLAFADRARSPPMQSTSGIRKQE